MKIFKIDVINHKVAILNSILFILLIIPKLGWAATVNGMIKNGELTWSNGINLAFANTYTLSDWQTVSNLPPTLEWVGGTFDGAPTITTFTGPTSGVAANVTVIGAEYNLGSASGISSTNDLGAHSICAIDSGSSGVGIVSIANDPSSFCVSKDKIVYASSIMPFYFVRPIFKLDSAALIDALRSASAIEGTYTGTVSYFLKYFYRTSSGALTYYLIPQTFSVSIYYEPDFLTDVSFVSNTLSIIPTYDTANRSAAGTATFQGIATGYLSQGLLLQFSSRNYNLINVANGNYKIPYSIFCAECQDQQIVIDGVLQLANNETVILPGSDPGNLPFTLRVDYNITDPTTIISGDYTDSFTVIFIENL
ncbi:hypothetical protein KDD30_17530 (plasmid) [Photobacterium sp. GJ3]|uniref:hypothetical protein n=1 Tax=Photobacterium sp. GJ3 TaxID=2829502 RepID=UPI001B8D810A|nr:hypothetical protein [Photobacterium sp. GJ3]QUJ69960.1 hypothetical protein KDD30_17530 [Photobacterium sp. GJ3]